MSTEVEVLIWRCSGYANPSPTLEPNFPFPVSPYPLNRSLLPSCVPTTPTGPFHLTNLPFPPSSRPARCLRSTVSAGNPVEVNLLSESDGGIVISDLARGGAVGAGQGDTVVDIKNTVSAARGIDVGRSRDGIGLGIDLTLLPDATSGDDGLSGGGGRRILREVVRREEGAGDVSVELGVTMVGTVDDSELEAARVVETQMELAVQSVFGHRCAGSNVGLEVIEAEGDDLQMRSISRWYGREKGCQMKVPWNNGNR